MSPPAEQLTLGPRQPDMQERLDLRRKLRANLVVQVNSCPDLEVLGKVTRPVVSDNQTELRIRCRVGDAFGLVEQAQSGTWVAFLASCVGLQDEATSNFLAVVEVTPDLRRLSDQGA